MCVDLFFLGQVFQAVGFLLWAFTPFFVYKGSPWRNTIVPKLLLLTTDAVFIYIPGLKVFIYLIYVYRSTLLESEAAPFLLMCTINCIFILLVWYNTILTPYIESEKAKLQL